MYSLIQNHLASMQELKTVYTLDEALKLHALMQMRYDIDRQRSEELEAKYKHR